MKKIFTVIGLRPKFIKASFISKLIIKNYENKILEMLVHSGQHSDKGMSKTLLYL